MSDKPKPQKDLKWLEEFEDLANEQLEEGSSCEQVHPIIERWYTKLLEGDPPKSRDSVLQAMACLSNEILFELPDDLMNTLTEHVDEDDLLGFIEYVLLIGRAFEIGLHKGDLDDL
jgi:hypothetical protein